MHTFRTDKAHISTAVTQPVEEIGDEVIFGGCD